MQTKYTDDLFVKTPLIESLELKNFCSNRVYLKLENCQPSGSYKMRGISRLCQHAALNGYEEIISSSGGNAGLAVACSARRLGLKSRIFVPKLTSKLMRDRIEAEGSDIVIAGDVWNDANESALKATEESKAFYVHPFDHSILWSGHSTMIDEIAQELQAVPSMVIACCGGGGLLCGIIEGMRRHGWDSVPVLAMETRGGDCFNLAVRTGGQVIRPVRSPAFTSVATSLGSLIICEQLAQYYNDCKPPVLSYLVDDSEAVDACIKFLDQHRMLVEPVVKESFIIMKLMMYSLSIKACGASLAALYTGLVKQLFQQNPTLYSDGPVVVIVCGGASITWDSLKDFKNRFNL